MQIIKFKVQGSMFKVKKDMYKIQANQSGTRSIEVSAQHLETIDKYQLLRNLVDSNGIIDEEVLQVEVQCSFSPGEQRHQGQGVARPLPRRNLPSEHEGSRSPQSRIALRRLEGQ